jgi:hypothetical protein
MARHSSNRERIERLAKEAEVTRKEKAAAAETKKSAPAKKKTTRKTATKTTTRTRAVWLVCDQSGTSVKTYKYRDEEAARAEAEKRTQESGKTHFVKRGEVPFD